MLGTLPPAARAVSVRLGIAVAVLAIALPASALGRTARFRISLSGTYTAHATMTDTSCWSSDPNDNVTYFAQNGSATEHDTFHSLAPITLTVGQLLYQHTVDAGSFARLRTVFLLNRTSATDPRYCTPDEANHPLAPDCGTRRNTYSLWVYGRTDHPAFSYLFSRGDTTYYPDDPFTVCPLFGPFWPGQLETSGPAPVKPGQLFNRRLKTIVVHGRNRGTTSGDPESAGTSHGTFDLEWTLTLKRTR
jgi:hypothetical protein